MALLGIDLGGTKLALAVFSEEGKILSREITSIGNRKGTEVGKIITEKVSSVLLSCDIAVKR